MAFDGLTTGGKWLLAFIVVFGLVYEMIIWAQSFLSFMAGVFTGPEEGTFGTRGGFFNPYTVSWMVTVAGMIWLLLLIGSVIYTAYNVKKYQKVTGWSFITLTVLGLVLNVLLLALTWVFVQNYGQTFEPVSWNFAALNAADFATTASTVAALNFQNGQTSYLINWVIIDVIIFAFTTLIVVATCGVVWMPKNRDDMPLTKRDLAKDMGKRVQGKSKPIFDSNLSEKKISKK